MKKLSHTADAYVELSLVTENSEGDYSTESGEVVRTSIQVLYVLISVTTIIHVVA